MPSGWSPRNRRACGCRWASLSKTAATVWHIYGTAYYALVEGARAHRGSGVRHRGRRRGRPRRRRPRPPSGPARRRRCRLRRQGGSGARYGACDVINYRSEDLRERIKSITGGEGVDICFDNVGGTIFEQMARLMKWGGRLMPIGFTSGQIPPVPMNLPLLKNSSIVGVFSGAGRRNFQSRPRG